MHLNSSPQSSPPRVRSPRSRNAAGKRVLVLSVLVTAVGSTFWRLFHILDLAGVEWQASSENLPQVTIVKNKNSSIDVIVGEKRQKVSLPVNNNNNNKNDGQVWLAGIIRDASTEIQPQVLMTLVELNCRHDIAVHIVATRGVKECLQSYEKLVDSLKYSSQTCASFHVEKEPPHLNAANDNRIDRIALVRDYQRQELREIYGATVTRQDVVIIADLDLYSLPNVDILMKQLQQDINTHDAICAAGVMYRPFGYYDIFATVLLPDTFVYPLRGRMNQTAYDGEDLSLIRSNDLYGNFTQWDLLDYFQHESAKRSGLSSSAVPVRSCFGGLTLYRASVWLEPTCTYHHVNNNTTTQLQKYATKTSQRPCEHVVLHDCLMHRNPAFKIAVQPSLTTEWNQNAVFTNKMYPGNRHESLGVFQKHGNEGDFLINGNYTLSINTRGVLVVERHENVMWSAEPSMDIDYWTHSFLMLKPNGVLELVRQVSKSNMEERNHYGVCTNGTTTCECDVKSDHCKVVVWTSDATRGKKDKREIDDDETFMVLVLNENGKLAVLDEKMNKTVWKNIKSRKKRRRRKKRFAEK